MSVPADSVWLVMTNYPLQYKTEIAIQLPTLVVEPVRAPNTVHCHKWYKILHIYVCVCAHVGNVGIRDGVKNNTKCNIIISEYSVLQMRWMKRWPHQADTGMLNLALVHTPCYREGAHTMVHASGCAQCAVILWYIIYRCPWCYSCKASIIVDDHFVSHVAEQKWVFRWFRLMNDLCSTVQSLLVQNQFQIIRETQTQTHAIHTYMHHIDQYCRYTHQKSEREEVKLY